MRQKGLTLESYTEEMKVEEREKGDDATVSLLFFMGQFTVTDGDAFSSSASPFK